MNNLQEPILGRFPEEVNISNSEIQTFKMDRRLWWLAYYRGLAPIEKTLVGPLPLGTRIHNALEHYYVTGGNPVDEYGRLQRIDNQLFLETRDATDESRISKFNKEAELGRVMLEGYMDWMDETNPDADIIVIGAEKKLSYNLEKYNHPRVTLVGKVDLQIRRASDGSRATLDHKSCLSFDPYYKYSHLSEQLMTYTSLERMNPDENDTPVDGGTYNLLKKVKRTASAKPPFYERIDVRFNKKTLDSFWIRTLGTINDIMNVRDALDNGEDHRYVAYPSPSMDWKTGNSPFFPIYSMIDDGSSFEAYIEDHYEQIDPNARYGENENDSL